MLTQEEQSGHGSFDSLLVPGQPSFYYSLACDNGGFDYDQPPFNSTNVNLCEYLPFRPGGAVGLVAYSRWGWVGSSHLLQRSFFDSLFANPNEPAVAAMYGSKSVYHYYRDLVYGQNYFGDPTMRVYTAVPSELSISIDMTEGGLQATVISDGSKLRNCTVHLSLGSNNLGSFLTDNSGRVDIDYNFQPDSVYTITAVSPGHNVSMASFVPSIVTGINDDERPLLPDDYMLNQNYPNPFNPTTTISFNLPVRTNVQLTVFNILGQEVSRLVDDELAAGSHTVTWDGRAIGGSEAASGVYLYRLQTDMFADVKKMILTR
jgi:hypothetical protein